MIKFIIARNDNKIFNEYLKPSLNKLKNKIEIYEIFNDENLDSIFKKYNKGIELANPKDDDILAFFHEDIRILDENVLEKVEMIFNKRKNVGVIGVIGTKKLGEIGWWSNFPEYHVGHIQQGLNNKPSYHMIKKICYDEEMVVIDGCGFFVKAEVCKKVKFLDNVFNKSYHFYDYSYCISVLEKGWKIACADILLEHESEGELPKDWFDSRLIFHKYIIDKGMNFPLMAKDIIRRN